MPVSFRRLTSRIPKGDWLWRRATGAWVPSWFLSTTRRTVSGVAGGHDDDRSQSRLSQWEVGGGVRQHSPDGSGALSSTGRRLALEFGPQPLFPDGVPCSGAPSRIDCLTTCLAADAARSALFPLPPPSERRRPDTR